MGVRVLVVEPSQPVARAIANVLERRDYHVTVVGGAAESNQYPGRFDCGVFSDVLPDGNGIALAGWLLAENRIGAAVFFGHAEDVDTRLRASNLGTYLPRSEGLRALSSAVADAMADVGEQARAVGGADVPGGRAKLKSGKRRLR